MDRNSIRRKRYLVMPQHQNDALLHRRQDAYAANKSRLLPSVSDCAHEPVVASQGSFPVPLDAGLLIPGSSGLHSHTLIYNQSRPNFALDMQNIELLLGKLHQQLKSKKFLAHVKPVQTPLANGKRRYTMQHHAEISDGTHSGPTVEEESFFPKTKLSLIDRFNNCDDAQETTSPNSEASKNKKARQN